ncbi:hypothetical protein D3C75_791060 [compost metagenome]
MLKDPLGQLSRQPIQGTGQLGATDAVQMEQVLQFGLSPNMSFNFAIGRPLIHLSNDKNKDSFHDGELFGVVIEQGPIHNVDWK